MQGELRAKAVRVVLMSRVDGDHAEGKQGRVGVPICAVLAAQMVMQSLTSYSSAWQ